MAKRFIDPTNRNTRRTRQTNDYPNGFSRFGTPTTCGVRMPWGGECGADTEGLGRCDRHQAELQEQLRAEKDRSST